jgi:hypothetical protein
MKNRFATRTFFMISILILLLGSCTPGEVSTQVATLVPGTSPPESTQSPAVTLPPPALVFLAGTGADQTLVAQLEPAVMQFAAEVGLVYERRDIMGLDSAPQNTQMVVAIGPTPTIAELLPVMPDIQFVAVGMDGLPLSPNLTAVTLGTNERYSQAFLAGYIAAMTDVEYRVGVISLGDVEGQRYRDSFLNGAVYFCGFCNPIYPPYWEYPLFYEVPPGASPEMWQQAAEDLISRSVTTVHVAPGAADERLLVYLAERGQMIVGTGQPPEAAMGNWIASVEVDYASGFAQVLRDVLQGGALGQVAISLTVSYANPGYMSEGRLNHLKGVIEELENGMIDPLGE